MYTRPVRRAVVDVGSNSVLLLVAEQGPDGWEPVVETSAVTGLGVGVRASGRIGEAGAAATLTALRSAFAQARDAGADEVAAAGTMALRIAQNAEHFRAAAAAQGTPVAVISGDEEAELGLACALGDPICSGSSRVSVLDPGGHSTEFATFDRAERRNLLRRSVPIGALGAKERLRQPDTPGPLDRLSLCAWADDEIGLCYLPGQCGTVVLLGATGTNLVSVRDGLAEWKPDAVHGATLTYEEVSLMAAALCGMSPAERRGLVGLEPGREGTIHTGALLLERCLFALRAEEARVSVRGWRHALVENSPRFSQVLACSQV